MNGLLVVISLFAIWPWSSTKEYRLISGSNVPAATGIVKVKTDKDNGNTELDIKVEHLARPSSLNPPASAYLVWVRPSAGAAVKQGAIRVNDDLKGQLKVVTVAKDFDLLVTAEQSESVSTPSPVEVLHAHVSPK